MAKSFWVVILICSLCLPVCATENIESLTKRISELEKGNLVLHEDLARTRLELDMIITLLQKNVSTIDAKTDGQKKELLDKTADLNKLLVQETTAREELTKKAVADETAHSAELSAQKAQDDALQTTLATTKKELLDQIEALRTQLSRELAAQAELTKKMTADSSREAELNAQKALAASLQLSVEGTKKDLLGSFEALQKQLNLEITARQELARNSAAMNADLANKLNVLTKALVELAERTPQERVSFATAPPGSHSYLSEILDQQKLNRVEIYRLRIVNAAKGEITASRDGGKTWEAIGHVDTPVETITNEPYLPRKWAPVGVVAATAVNAIAVRTGFDTLADRGLAFSILPQMPGGAEATRTTRNTRHLPEGTMLTDIPAGSGIFGGDWTPIPGNPVSIETHDGLQPIPIGYTPKTHDVLVMRVLQPKDSPQAYIFENRFGGAVSELGWDGHEKAIGKVLKPVFGIGRLDESSFTDAGRLSASLNGLLEISVAPAGKVGGFEILLYDKGMTTEMMRARFIPQWMVIEEFDAHDPTWEGIAPLFLAYLHPSWSSNDWDSSDWLRLVTSRVLIDVRINNGNWQPMPKLALDADAKKPLPEWARTALKDITHVRILLPVPPKAQEH